MGFCNKKWLKKTLSATLAAASMLTMLPAFAGAASESAITTANVNLRKDATTSSQSSGIVAKGTMITIVDHEGKWYEVKVNGKTGYIRSDYVEKMDTNRVIKEGVKGDDVKYLQTALKELGLYSGEITGNAGPKTIAAVQSFQKKYDLSADGKVGAATWAKLQSVAGSSSSTTTTKTVLKEGAEGDTVKEVQRKLKQAGYLTGSVDGKFGPQTSKAVKSFQKKYDFTVDGIVGPVTLKKLDELTNESASTSTKTVLRMGATGSEVKKMQEALKELGFYKKSVDGEFGAGTLAAVKAFQIKNKLTADGVAGSATLGKLYGSSAVSAGTSTTSSESSEKKNTSSKPSASSVQLLEWSQVKKEIESREIITVYDVKSGKTYKVRQLASGNHCDVEPLTAEDTAIMKEINGGEFTWSPRPVWVTFDGMTIACSIHSMPHDVSTIKDNNFNGHVCMHFLGSKTHNGNAAYTQDHQDVVQAAWKLANK